MPKLDLKRKEHSLYDAPKGHAVVVDVPEEAFLMLEGSGSPNEGTAFQDAINTLYAVAHALRATMKEADPARDFVVMPLEALWGWHEKEWRWTLMIRQPDFVRQEDVDAAIRETRQRAPRATDVRFDRFREGRAMQTMHVGPYTREGPTVERLHEELRRAGFVSAGKQHEIYLGDPRRAKPENLRTIIRQPVRRADEVAA